MPSLNSLIDAKTKSPSAKVTFNGATTRDLLSINVSTALEGSIGTASIRTQSNPNISPEAKVQIRQGYNGQHQLTFTGYVDSIEPSELENTWTINCRDVLKKAMDTFLIQEVKFGQDIAAGQYYYSTYTSTDGGTFTIHQYSSIAALNAAHPETTGNYSTQGVKAHAVVQWLLHMSGLAEGTEIQVDDTNFWIGDINPAKFHLTSVYDAAQQIANLIGWRIYADAAGVARFKRKPRQPGGYTYWKYTTKGSPYNIDKLTKTSTNIDLRNYVEVRGASGIRTVKRAASPYIGNTPYRGVLISEELIDTPGIAEFMATRVLQDLNRLKITIAMETDGNPLIGPGSTVDVTSSKATGKYLVEQYQTNMSADGGYKASIQAAQYLGDTKFDEDATADIVAVFTPVFVSVLGDPKWYVEFDGAASYSSQGVITQYVWTWPDSTTTTSTESSATFVFDEAAISGGNSQDVTLQVYDAIGNTASTTQPITTSGLEALATVKYRAIYGALTTQAVGSVDGGQIWYTNSIPAISVAASNFGPGGVYVTSGHALFGTSDGKIYKTSDTCITMTQVLAPGGQVTDVHIPELDSTKAVAVTSTGKVYYSDTAGDSWSQIGSFGFSLRQCKMHFTNFKEVTIVGSGVDNVYITENLGGAWAKLGVGNYDVLWATDGSQTNYFAHTAGVLGSGPAGVAALTFSGGGSVAVPAATVMVDRDDGVMIVDVNGQHWVADDNVFYATQNNSSNKTQHMIRDGEMLDIVFYATASGISKSLNRNQTIQALYYPIGSMPAEGWGKKVAYGPMAAVFAPTQLVFRGVLRDIGDDTANNGFHLATTSGWVYGCENRTAATMIAPTIGGFALSENAGTGGDAAIHLIRCTPASGVNNGIGTIVFNDTWNTADGSDVFGLSFNRRPDSRNMLCALVLNTDVPLGVDINGQIFRDFVLEENGYTTSQTLVDLDIDRGKWGQNTTSVLGEMMFMGNSTNFSPDIIYSVVFGGDESMTLGTPISDGSQPRYAPHQKAAPTYKGLGVENASNDFGTVTPLTLVSWNGSAFVYDNTQIDSSVDMNGVYGSYVDQAKIYYGVADGIYSVDGYGLGTPSKIFDLDVVYPSGSLYSMRVTSNSTTTEDYLTAIVAGYPTPAGYFSAHHVFYSLDSGSTWIEGPPIYDIGAGGAEAAAYVIDPL